MESFLGSIRQFGVGRLAAMLGVGAGVVAVLVALVMFMGKEPSELLYSNLDLKEASEVTQALDQAGIKYETKGDGSTIMVPRDKVASARLMVAGKGLVSSGSIGYEIFDTNNALGQTDFVQQLNRQRALQGELERTIKAMQGVNSVRVHLVLPKRQLFEEDAEQPSAAVTIGVGSREPSSDMVRAIQNLVSSSVPNMKAEKVAVIDQHGKTLSAPSDESLAGKMAQDRKSEVEARIAKTVKDMIEGVLGPGKARVNVTAELDLNRVTTQEERFDPDGQVIRSESTTEASSQENKNDDNAGVTAAANVPGGQGANGFQQLGSRTGQNDAVTNYEISKSVTTTVQEPGTIKKIAVAVAIDGVSAPMAADGKPGAYTPRTAQEIQQIEELVKTAVGFDAERGDQVRVTNIKFPQPEDQGLEEQGLLAGFDKNDIMRAAELGVLAVVALLILLFAVRPFIKNLSAPAPGQIALAGPSGGPPVTRLVTLADGTQQQVVVDQSGEPIALAGPPVSDIDQRIDIAKIEGQVKASSIKRVSEFVEKHPDESVAILRNWLHEST
ncbi:flagellar M-ring protein FliF [Caulobacter vibrioides]|nr:flagellar basal-body MS-ring/collar protein FliF [Caulobacter vibrioides]YP_002516323.1 flagellar M-ring protein FliF [Caulobacter vibrioides NA1000]ACL94415.1 flagellar M-ring protein FliF [Caulobacter vibrioides NA1000]ATC23868.1 flagellar M-ring protein FliF [Caulobacter vibrioides]ATC27742.1 flagellar M-ring protein FliF [Caulobacter vibrioides]AZH12102.1 flagellar M-ring protein FliF [Caulobacter vibrioides]PLR15924.1 flagellar M-ring protein FliF [Caulobacter vibrioides]